jgi:cellulose synthase/poly-beta-1,6-N-acetylglucosamine synthase-like glycosyltransferase
MRKRTVVVPRKKEFGEHTNDHQTELERVMGGHLGIAVVGRIESLEAGINLALTQSVGGAYKGYIPRILSAFAKEQGFNVPPLPTKKGFKPPQSASIVVSTLNGGQPLVNAIHGMLNQDFNGKYEVIVVDDGSFDGKTPELLKKNVEKNPRVKLIFLPRSGVCKARNEGIRAAKYEIVVNMDHDDNPEKDWLRIMMSGFDSPNVGAVSAYGHYGGTSTGFRKDLLTHLGGYDEDFFYYREDTDLSFRIMELGFEYQKVNGAKWHGDRTLVTPHGMGKLLGYTLQRFRYHMNDVLLHKKHSMKLCQDFLHVKWNFWVDPREDFKIATGLWQDSEREPALSSPRGMTFLPNKGMIHFGLIILAGLGYAFVMKWARLAGSLKHKHVLV